MAGIVVLNPTDWVDGTAEDDSFTVTNDASGVEFLDGEGGYDTLVIDRSFATMSDIRLSDFYSGAFYGTIGGGYDPQFVVSHFEDVTITGSPGPDHFTLKIGPDSLGLRVAFNAGSGVDALTLEADTATYGLTIDARTDTVSSSFGSYAGFETYEIHGGSGDDVLRTGAGSDILWGGGGTNVLDSGPGIDQIYSMSLTDFSDGGDDNDGWSPTSWV